MTPERSYITNFSNDDVRASYVSRLLLVRNIVISVVEVERFQRNNEKAFIIDLQSQVIHHRVILIISQRFWRNGILNIKHGTSDSIEKQGKISPTLSHLRVPTLLQLAGSCLVILYFSDDYETIVTLEVSKRYR